MLDDYLLTDLDAEKRQQLESMITRVSGGLAPFDPYLHWSVNRRERFLKPDAATIVAELMAGLFVIDASGECFLARRFLNTSGWIWACVPLLTAQPDNRMLLTMMDGAA